MLLAKRKKKRTIIFVCTGNTCRSPMAQGLMQQFLDENNIKSVEVKTAGVLTIPGLLPTQEAVQVMEAAGIDIRRHRSAQLTAEMIRKADLVLGMTPFHVQATLRASDHAQGKTFLLKEYTKSDLKNFQITDPMGATLEVYKRVFREIKLAIDKLCEMDVVHAPLDDALKHEKWVAPKPESKAKAPAPPKEEPAPEVAAPVADKKPAPTKKAPAKKAPAAKNEEAPAKPAPAKPAAKKKAPAKKKAAKA